MKALEVQIKREFWEHRALWIAPVSVAAALLAVVAIFGHQEVIHLDTADGVNATAGRAPMVFQVLVMSWAMVFYVTAAIMTSIYLLDCLYSERRDRSILFWKSLPVSDTRTVLVKFLVGLVIVPLGCFLLAAATSALASGILHVRHSAALNADPLLWDTTVWLRLQGVMLYAVVVSLLWYAPYAAYLMLASAWARRSPYMWALIPPILLALFEHMVFGTYYVSRIFLRSYGELSKLAFRSHGGSGPLADFPEPTGLLASPQLGLGLAAAALMLALAIRLRRYRDDS
jgi:ABC-2 type transport system permease protein